MGRIVRVACFPVFSIQEVDSSDGVVGILGFQSVKILKEHFGMFLISTFPENILVVLETVKNRVSDLREISDPNWKFANIHDSIVQSRLIIRLIILKMNLCHRGVL